ncbi:MAG: ComEA family DNA-binding protein [Candidatus Berkelbacteria bacterium]|nr:ComEA family DNA-binding protein [Candidatus Berkelbacteria bacterium]
MKIWIEKYSTWIGVGLIVLALVGGVLLMVKKGAWASGETQNQPIENRDKEISDLKSKISDLEKQIVDSKTVTAVPVSENTTSPSSAAKSATPSGKININTATAAQLDSLPGIGPTYSQRIVDYRNTNGPFSSIDKIQDVKGIGAKTFAKFKDLITI